MENEPNADLPQADDPARDAAWDGIAESEAALWRVQATDLEGTARLVGATAERKRNLAIVAAEIAEGVRRGIPATSGVMVMLARIAAAIENAHPAAAIEHGA